MATRVTNGARRERRVSQLCRSRARALLSLNLKQKRDCSQSIVCMMGWGTQTCPPTHHTTVAREGPVSPPLVGLLLSKQPTIFRWWKRHDNNLAVKAGAHFLKICFFVKYSRQRLLSLVNMGLHAAIIRLSNRLLDWARWYTRESSGINHIYNRRSPDGDLVSSLCDPRLENPGYAPVQTSVNFHRFAELKIIPLKK